MFPNPIEYDSFPPRASVELVPPSWRSATQHDVFPVRTEVNSMIVWHYAQASGSV